MFEYRMVRLTLKCAKLNLDFFLSFQSLQWTHHHDVFSGHTTMTYKVYLFAVCFQCPRAAHKYRPPKALNTYPANGVRQILQFHRVMYRLWVASPLTLSLGTNREAPTRRLGHQVFFFPCDTDTRSGLDIMQKAKSRDTDIRSVLVIMQSQLISIGRYVITLNFRGSSNYPIS